MFDLTTVGHFAIDLITSPRIRRPKPTLGGPPTFCSVAARKLDARVSVVSKVGGDFPPEYIDWLVENGVDLSGLKRFSEALTTRFLLEYEDGRRRLQLKARAPTIEPDDIPESTESRAIHIGPIANELSAETIRRLRIRTEILSLDPQGLIRRFDVQGNVSLKKIEDVEILKIIDIFKCTTKELSSFVHTSEILSAVKSLHHHGIGTVIVTRGMKGSVLSHKGRVYRIPACRPEILIDPTGAGDVFIGAFLAEYLRNEDVAWCACVGSAAASFVVEGVGSSSFGEKNAIYERASVVSKNLRAVDL